MTQLTVTTLEQLKEYTKGQIVELPPFADGQTFVARMKRPSMLELASTGAIENKLLATASDLFIGGVSNVDSDNDMLSKLLKLMETFADKALVEPTYKQIKDIGLSLTDDQFIFIMSYCQSGVDALKSFRANKKDREHNSDV